MDFWENIPSRKEQEAVLGRTRRAVSSRPELEDALPEWAVELLSPTAFWPESYMPVPPDFGDRPKPPRSRSQPLPPAPRYQPLPPVPRYQPLPLKGPALCLDFQRGAAFYTFQKGPALYLPFPRGSAIQTFQKGLYLAFVFADAGHLWVFAVARLQTFFFVPSSWLPSTNPIWT
ncbi:unnamed protein product [Boreogadus saida]